MGKRKRIGLLLPNVEGVYQQRIMEGVYARCEKYGYDVLVFAMIVQVCHRSENFLQGELSIFDLMNFDELDAVVFPTMSLNEDNVDFVVEDLARRFKQECTKPVISIDLPIADYPCTATDDRSSFSRIAEHVLDVHHCSRIYFLNGPFDFPISQKRIAGFRKVFEDRGIEYPQEYIFEGDFWYPGGEKLADMIAAGEVEMPDAVVCASDHMAIGLANRLIKHGIKVPEQVIVTGYDATMEALINEPSITTYIPDVSTAAADAVDELRRILEPGEEVLPKYVSPHSGLCTCVSCGCGENTKYVKQRIATSVYCTNRNFGSEQDKMDISRLLDSYIMEYISEAESPDDCLLRIASSAYLLRPFEHLDLCLNNTWLNTDIVQHGFTDRMKIAMHCTPTEQTDPEEYSGDTWAPIFDRRIMFPRLAEECDKPRVFYFNAVHYNEKVMGYMVLESCLDDPRMLDVVYRNWIRYVNNALEVSRIQNRLMKFSQMDPMTGLLNRRGMDELYKHVWGSRVMNSRLLVFVIDMDGLKFINDTYGHREGDYGITTIAAAVRHVSKSTEICVRAGGDEFYLIGVDTYDAEEPQRRVDKFFEYLKEENRIAAKPFEVSASIGYQMVDAIAGLCLDQIICEADEEMYRNKCERKKQRLN